MGCKYYKNGVESKLYTELFGYMDNTAPEKKSAEAVYKILKSNGIATRRGGSIFLIQPNVENSLREINNILKFKNILYFYIIYKINNFIIFK